MKPLSLDSFVWDEGVVVHPAKRKAELNNPSTTSARVPLDLDRIEPSPPIEFENGKMQIAGRLLSIDKLLKIRIKLVKRPDWTVVISTHRVICVTVGEGDKGTLCEEGG